MLRNILIAIYIFTVLLISAVSKAEVELSKVSIDQGSNTLRVEGQVNNICFADLKVRLSDDHFDAVEGIRSATISVEEFGFGKCELVESSRHNFEAIYDLRTLGLQVGVKYRLVVNSIGSVKNSSREFVINNILEENKLSYSSSSYEGTVLESVDGQFVLVEMNSQSLVVLNSGINLSKYNGKKVVLSGIDLKHEVEKLDLVDGVDPLLDVEKIKGPSVFVYRILDLEN